jgi:hypothetical protein
MFGDKSNSSESLTKELHYCGGELDFAFKVNTVRVYDPRHNPCGISPLKQRTITNAPLEAMQAVTALHGRLEIVAFHRPRLRPLELTAVGRSIRRTSSQYQNLTFC